MRPDWPSSADTPDDVDPGNESLPEPAPPPDLPTVLAGLDDSLAALRTQLDLLARERQHQAFSPARLVGAGAQTVAVLFLMIAVADWLGAADNGRILVELGFAAVLQMGALTAFVLARDER